MPQIVIDQEEFTISVRLEAIFKLLAKNAAMIEWVKTGSLDIKIGPSQCQLFLHPKIDYITLSDKAG